MTTTKKVGVADLLGALTAASRRAGSGLWIPTRDLARMPSFGRVARLLTARERHRNVLAVLRRPDGALLLEGSNIVTDDGDVWYAQKVGGETPTNDFAAGLGVLCSAGTPGKSATYASFTPIANASVAPTASYPKRNDGDTNNTGRGVNIVTWKYDYTTTSFNHAAIVAGLITIASPVSGSKLLTGYSIASFSKTATDTLAMYINHQILGV